VTGQPPPPPSHQEPNPQSGYLPPGGPGALLSPSHQRMWAMLAHLSGLAGAVIGLTFVGPLVIYLLFKDRGAFVRDQAAEALNFQILVNIVLVVSIPVFVQFAVVTLGIGVLLIVPVLLAIAIGSIVLMILGAVTANNGELFRYAVNWRLVS
jgi:uncharacterized protein